MFAGAVYATAPRVSLGYAPWDIHIPDRSGRDSALCRNDQRRRHRTEDRRLDPDNRRNRRAGALDSLDGAVGPATRQGYAWPGCRTRPLRRTAARLSRPAAVPAP